MGTWTTSSHTLSLSDTHALSTHHTDKQQRTDVGIETLRAMATIRSAPPPWLSNTSSIPFRVSLIDGAASMLHHRHLSTDTSITHDSMSYDRHFNHLIDSAASMSTTASLPSPVASAAPDSSVTFATAVACT